MDTTGALLMKKVLSPLSSHTVAAALASRPIVTKPTRERQARREPARQSHSRYERARNACPSLSIRHLCVLCRYGHPHDGTLHNDPSVGARQTIAALTEHVGRASA